MQIIVNSSIGDTKRRMLSNHQKHILEDTFRLTKMPSTIEKQNLANTLKMPLKSVKAAHKLVQS